MSPVSLSGNGPIVPPTSGEPIPVPTEPRPVDVEEFRARMEAKRRGVVTPIPVVAASPAEPAPAAPRRAPSAPAPLSTPPDAEPEPATAPEPVPVDEPEVAPVAPAAAASADSRASRSTIGVDEARAIVEDYLTGESIPRIAATTGRSTSTVRRVLLDADVRFRDDRATRSGGRAKTAADDDPELAEVLVSGYTAGRTIKELALEHGRSAKLVTNVLRRAGVELRPHRGVEQVDPAVVEEIRRLYVEEGLSQAQVATRLGLSSQATVSKIMRRHNIPRRTHPCVSDQTPATTTTPEPTKTSDPAEAATPPTEPAPPQGDTAPVRPVTESFTAAVVAPAPSKLHEALAALADFVAEIRRLHPDLTRREFSIVLAALQEYADPVGGEW